MFTVARDSSFLLFVLPFLFEDTAFERHVEILQGARWEGDNGPFAIWQSEPFNQDQLLRHVAEYLNPLPEKVATAHLFAMHGNAMKAKAGLSVNARWTLLLPRADGARPGIDFRVHSVQLCLFRVGVGFLTVRAMPESAALDDWQSFLHYFRFTRREGQVGVQVRRKIARDQEVGWFPQAPDGSEAQARGIGTFEAITGAILATGSLAQGAKSWWQPVFVPGQLLPFATLYLDSDGPEAPSEEEIGRCVYALRNFFHARQELHPSTADLRLDDHPGLFQYARDQWFTFSLNGGTFLAFNAPRTQFFRSQLPEHLETTYFLLFLIALHQRFALLALSAAVAENWLDTVEGEEIQHREETFVPIRDRLLWFMARGYFTQVMQQEHHHRAYRAWHEAFAVDRLFNEVHNEVQQMYQHLLLQRTEHLQQLEKRQLEQERRAKQRQEEQQARTERREKAVGRVAGVFGLPAFAFGITGSSLSWPTVLMVGVLTAIVGGALQSLVRRYIARAGSELEAVADAPPQLGVHGEGSDAGGN